MQNTYLRDSGAYSSSFYTSRYISLEEIQEKFDSIEWNRELHKKYHIDEEDLITLSQDEIEDRITESLDDTFLSNYYREVSERNYDEETAYICGLIPFKLIDYKNKYNDLYLLSLGGCGMDLSPKIDAYYFLKTGCIDQASSYFHSRDYFKDMVSSEIFNKIEKKFNRIAA